MSQRKQNMVLTFHMSCAPTNFALLSAMLLLLTANAEIPRELVVWTQGYGDNLAASLRDAFHRDEVPKSGCSSATISIPPVTANKRMLRPVADTLRLKRFSLPGHPIHAAAEFHYDSWNSWLNEQGENASWSEVGCLFRLEMFRSGYNVSEGDTWEINEAPHTIRTNGTFRKEFLSVVSGLAWGCASDEKSNPDPSKACTEKGLPPDACLLSKGTLYLAGFGQKTDDVKEFKNNLKHFLMDEYFFRRIGAFVKWFADETYVDPSAVCAENVSVLDQLQLVSSYSNHLIRLARAGGTLHCPAALHYLSTAFVPLMNNVYGCDGRGYGDTNVTLAAWANLTRLQYLASLSTALNDTVSHPTQITAFGFGTYLHEHAVVTSVSASLASSVVLPGPCEHRDTVTDRCRCLIPNAVPAWQWIDAFGHWDN